MGQIEGGPRYLGTDIAGALFTLETTVNSHNHVEEEEFSVGGGDGLLLLDDAVSSEKEEQQRDDGRTVHTNDIDVGIFIVDEEVIPPIEGKGHMLLIQRPPG